MTIAGTITKVILLLIERSSESKLSWTRFAYRHKCQHVGEMSTDGAISQRKKKCHVNSVLKAQKLMQETSRHGVNDFVLEKIAMLSSSESVEKALRRAHCSVDAIKTDRLIDTHSYV
jgi:hypothetical protein